MIKAKLPSGVLKLLVSSFALILAVTIARMGFGFYFRNNVLVIEGLHALIDAVISLLIIIAALIVRSEFSRKYPYGLYRLEDLASIIMAVIILLTLAVDYPDLLKPFAGGVFEALVVQSISIPMITLSAYLKAVAGRIMRSPSLRADAMHMAADIIEGSVVAAGLAIYYFILKSPIVYKVTLAVTVVGLVVAAYEACHESLKAILDLPRDEKVLAKAKEVINRVVSGYGEITDLKARWAGPVVYIETILKLHPLRTIEDAGRLSSRITSEIKKSIEGVEDVIVRIEPAVRKELVIAAPLESMEEISKLSSHFGKAEYFLIAHVVEGEVKSTRIIRNPAVTYRGRGGRWLRDVLVGARISEHLYNEGVTDVIAVNIGELAYSLLLRHKIIAWKGDPSKSVKENIEMLVNGELERLEEPTHEATWERLFEGEP